MANKAAMEGISVKHLKIKTKYLILSLFLAGTSWRSTLTEDTSSDPVAGKKSDVSNSVLYDLTYFFIQETIFGAPGWHSRLSI